MTGTDWDWGLIALMGAIVAAVVVYIGAWWTEPEEREDERPRLRVLPGGEG